MSRSDQGLQMARLLIDVDYLTSGQLPDVCIVCGRPSQGTVLRKFGAWESTRTIVRTKGKAAVPVCNRHRNHWLKMSLLFAAVMISGFTVWILVTVASFYLMDLVGKESPGLKMAICFGGLFGGLASFIIWIGLGASYLRTKHITGAGFQGNLLILDNVSTEFANACTAK